MEKVTAKKIDLTRIVRGQITVSGRFVSKTLLTSNLRGYRI